MLWSGLLNEQVTIIPITEGGADRYGNPSKVEGIPVTVQARVEPLRSPKGDLELLSQRDTLITEYTLFTLPNDALTGTSEVEWNGEVYQVNGHPKPSSGFLGPSHVETYLRRIEG
jgi:hypothetical protein